MFRRLAVTSAAALFVAAAALSLVSDAQDAGTKIAKILDRVEESKGANLWEDVRALEEVGKAGLADLRDGLTRADAMARTAAAAALYRLEFRDEGLDALSKVYGQAKHLPARRAAARAAALLAEGDARLPAKTRRDMAERLMKDANDSDEEVVKVLLNRGAYALTESIHTRRAVRDLFDKAKSPEVKDEAALALAQMDVFQVVKTHLMTMAARGDENGRMARAYLKVSRLTEDLTRLLEKGAPASKNDYKMLDEILEKLKEHYYDPAKVDEKKLIENAARGLLAGLDPYTAFYDEKAIEELKKEGLEGHYGGIGARVTMRKDKSGNAWLTISEPIFSGPAYRAGLRSHDSIVEIEGESTANKELGDLVRRLRGKPGTPATIKVFRRGWTKEREFKITREEVQLETTVSEMLPGSVGYVMYSTFGDLDDELKFKGSNIETQVKDLQDKGMKALILDLRGNSGGYLRTARRIASMFLDEGQVIVTTKAMGREVERYTARGRSADEDLSKILKVTVPVIVLINGESASASEILAGCLQDHGRAVLVGERSFGKGSVQDLKYLDTVDKKMAARITIAKWFLPKGKTVEKEGEEPGGVKPDVEVPIPERDFWKEAEYEKLRTEGKVEDYVSKQFEANRRLLEELAESDGGDVTRYPGIDDLYGSLTTRCTKEDVRELLREYVRKRVQDERKQAFRMDYQGDNQLQRAIVEACKKAGIDPAGIPKYQGFAKGEAK